MKKFFWLVLILVIILPLIGASCITVKSEKELPMDGGIFISQDKGKIWEQKTYIRTVNKDTETISSVNVMEMFFDPQDSQTIYIATENNGVYVSYNGGEQWDSFYSQISRVFEVAVDPTSRNIVYLSLGGKIVKTTDGGDTWDEVYFEAISGVMIKTIAVDYFDSNVVYLGASDGRFIRSVDGGKTWNRVYDFPANIQQILVNPNDGDIIYVATASSGVFRSENYGRKWHNISLGDDSAERARLNREYPGISNFSVMVFDKTQKDAILIGTNYGLLKNKDGEADWEAIRLLTLPRKINVVSLAISPQDNKEIYYGINNALYFSKDGGKSWAARSLPTVRMAQYILVDPDDPEKVYLGVYLPPPPEDDKKVFFK